MIAHGDVALSIICTFSTTVLGVVATPLLVRFLLATSVPFQVWNASKGIIAMVLLPLSSGVMLGQILFANTKTTTTTTTTTTANDSHKWSLQTLRDKYVQRLGLAATMILVAGGASNASKTFSVMPSSSRFLFYSIGISVVLPLFGGLAAWVTTALLQRLYTIPEPSKRALVIEVLRKSPTLAHVLALRHFGVEAAFVPAVSMVSLAVVGALVASMWQRFDPI